VRKAFYRVTLGTILNIVLNIILIPIYGIKGAAIASLFGHIAANYLYDIFDNDLHGQFVMKTKSLIPIHWYIANIKKER
jgi:O-antigen/teichoic acid export membrane protein